MVISHNLVCVTRVCANVVCQQWRLAVRPVSALWGLKPYGLGGSGHGDGVVFWFRFGQGVNKSGEEAMVLTSLQTILVVQETCLPSQTRATHTHSHTHLDAQYFHMELCFSMYLMIIT